MVVRLYSVAWFLSGSVVYIEFGLLPAWALRPEGRESLTKSRLMLWLVVQQTFFKKYSELQLDDSKFYRWLKPHYLITYLITYWVNFRFRSCVTSCPPKFSRHDSTLINHCNGLTQSGCMNLVQKRLWWMRLNCTGQVYNAIVVRPK
jgi:hypothetical protein